MHSLEARNTEANIVDAITILSKFNVSNLRQLLRTFRSEKVMMSELVFFMIKIAHKSDYFYLSHVPEAQLQQTLAHFFQNYLPLSISNNSIILRSSVQIAAFYCCWHVTQAEHLDVMFDLCARQDGLISRDSRKLTKIIESMITFGAFLIPQYQGTINMDVNQFLEIKQKIQSIR